MVRLLNSTPEPDGQLTSEEARKEFGARIFDRTAVRAGAKEDARWKAYMLRVPPTIERSCELHKPAPLVMSRPLSRSALLQRSSKG